MYKIYNNDKANQPWEIFFNEGDELPYAPLGSTAYNIDTGVTMINDGEKWVEKVGGNTSSGNGGGSGSGNVNGGIPVYKESELTRELMFELAKNRTVHFVVFNSEYGDAETLLITRYYAYPESENCGEMVPAYISAMIASYSSGWTIPDVTDDEVYEVRAAWDKMNNG